MKKMIFASIVAILVLTFAGVNATELECSDWAKEYIDKANKAGIISYVRYISDYTKPIQRGYIAELIAGAYENVTESKYSAGKSVFEDAYGDSISTVYELGIMNGKSETEFAPDDYTTRQEMAKVILMLKSVIEKDELVLPTNASGNFVDFDSLAEWAKPYVVKASEEGIIKGYEDGRFNGEGTVSWQEAITLISRAVDLNEKEKPIITNIEDGKIVSSDGFNIGVKCNRKATVYVQEFSESYPMSVGTCEDGKVVGSRKLKENYLYYVFAECNGVFSDPVYVYTDSYNLQVGAVDDIGLGSIKIKWKRIPGVELYTVKVTESRNSYYEGDIPPNTPRVYEIRYEDFINIATTPRRIYTIEITADEYYAKKDVYSYGAYFKDAEEIAANYPQTQEEAEKLMTTVTVPVWRLRNNNKVSSTATFEVHYMIAEKVKMVFEEIYNGPEKFPIKDVGGYSWRGGRSEHNGGTAIDINANENYCIYNNGTTIGSYWKPYEDPYSITPYGDVIKAFEKYGFTWGGDAWSNPKDYMHFSYLGT